MMTIGGQTQQRQRGIAAACIQDLLYNMGLLLHEVDDAGLAQAADLATRLQKLSSRNYRALLAECREWTINNMASISASNLERSSLPGARWIELLMALDDWSECLAIEENGASQVVTRIKRYQEELPSHQQTWAEAAELVVRFRDLNLPVGQLIWDELPPVEIVNDLLTRSTDCFKRFRSLTNEHIATLSSQLTKEDRLQASHEIAAMYDISCALENVVRQLKEANRRTQVKSRHQSDYSHFNEDL